MLLRDRLYRAIRDAILTYGFQPGMPIGRLDFRANMRHERISKSIRTIARRWAEPAEPPTTTE